MEKYLKKIQGRIPNTSTEVNINTSGKNLIITGPNGSGKTSFLMELYKKTEILIINKKQADLPSLESRYHQWKRQWGEAQKGTSHYDNLKRTVGQAKRELDEIKDGLLIDIPGNIDLSSKYDDKVAVIKIFQATRAANIEHAETARGLATEQENQFNRKDNPNLGNKLEQHLVNMKNRRSLAISEDHDKGLASKIESWFNNFEDNLKTLMEDKSTKLSFNSNTLKFSITQNEKPDYTFQTLSSGYLSIFDIYADLIMRSEYFKITPKELVGIVFIDEIDAHLHVSLQRLILPFFSGSFPQVQFIVTTHSPFVLTSAEDTVIFDIGKCSQVEEDISFCSYSSVMEGLLDTKATSLALDRAIKEISDLSNSEHMDVKRLSELVGKIKPNEGQLDDRSKAFFLKGLNTLLDLEG